MSNRNSNSHIPSGNSRTGSSLLAQVDFIGDDEDVDIVSDEPASLFDKAVGHIEDIMVDEEFQELQNTFFSNYNHIFSEREENSIECTNVHAEYIEAIEKHLEQELANRIEDFSMEDFAKELTDRKDELDGEVFEVLFTLTDFQSFKEAMLDYKSAMCGEAVDISFDLTVTALTPRACSSGGNGLTASSSDMEMASPAASLSISGSAANSKK